MKIIAFQRALIRGPELDDLHLALQLLLDGEFLAAIEEEARQAFLADLLEERLRRDFGRATEGLVGRFQAWRGLEVSGEVDATTAQALNLLLAELGHVEADAPSDVAYSRVTGTLRFADGSPAASLNVSAFHRSLRSEQLLGKSRSDAKGRYSIRYRTRPADIEVMIFDADKLLATSSTLFHASSEATVDVTIGGDARRPPSLFEAVGRALVPLLRGVAPTDLEENDRKKDLTYLSGVTGFDKAALARYVLALRAAQKDLPAEFWFALFGGTFFRYSDKRDLGANLAASRGLTASLDTASVRQTLANAVAANDIDAKFGASIDGWIATFAHLAASVATGKGAAPSLIHTALSDAGVTDDAVRRTVAQLYNENKAFPQDFLKALRSQTPLTKSQIDDVATSFQLSDLTRGDSSMVKALKENFAVRTPEQIPSLAANGVDEWVQAVAKLQSSGKVALPIALQAPPGQSAPPDAEVYGRMLERQFREAFPTSAFGGGLGRALKKGATPGLRHAATLSKMIAQAPAFDLLKTPIDSFLQQNGTAAVGDAANDDAFRTELKAVQRVFKLAPNFEASTSLLADGVHSAHQAYRMGKEQFVRRYAAKPGFDKTLAETAWNRAADTSAAVVTILADLQSLSAQAMPAALQNGNDAVSSFPNWQNLFAGGDFCDCEDCRSVLGPAAYFADLLVFLKNRLSADKTQNLKDLLFARRPDLGYLELGCDNALTPLPYVDVVCEVLEAAIANGEDDQELIGLSAIAADPATALAAVVAALLAAGIDVGADPSLQQVDASDPNRWVVHGDLSTYLLKKKATANFFAQVLPNTKADAAQLRAYPQYVSGTAYARLKTASYPLALPFDLFGEEVRASMETCDLARWDLMRTFQGPNAPNDPSDGEIAAEYFAIGVHSSDPIDLNPPLPPVDEKDLILVAVSNDVAQQAVWGETGNVGWLAEVSNLKNFLQKTALQYDDVLMLLDLAFLNPDGDIVIEHLDDSCDTAAKTVTPLDAAKLDRIHRFLRMWRKLDGWKAWELDLVLRHPRIGAGGLDEPFLIKLFYFCEIRKRLGKKATVEQVCALFHDLNTATYFTAPYKPRGDGLYRNLFLNKKLINPIDPAFVPDGGTGDLPAGTTIDAHMAVVQGALGVRQADLDIYLGLTRSSDGTSYVPATHDLTLANLSFLWRHSFLAKALKLNATSWKLVLKLLAQDVEVFTDPQAAKLFLDRIDLLTATGFTPDQADWILAADPAAKAASKDSDVSRFLLALRTQLQTIQTDNSPAKFPFLTATPPSDEVSLTALVTTLLQQLGRNDVETKFVIDSLNDAVSQQETVPGLGNLAFPAAMVQAGRVYYDQTSGILRFVGVMTDAEKAALTPLSAVPAYLQAISDFHSAPRLAFKLFAPAFVAPLATLPPAVNFPTLPDPMLAAKISYDPLLLQLQFAGILSPAWQQMLNALSPDAAYQAAIASLADQPVAITAPDLRIWLQYGDLSYPVPDPDPTKDSFALNLAKAATTALAYLSKSLSETAVVTAAAAQLGVGEPLTRVLLGSALLPDTLLTHFTVDFAKTSAAVDRATLPTTFAGWNWAQRVAQIWKKWNVTIDDWTLLAGLTPQAQLIDILTLPLDDTKPLANADAFARTGLLLRLRDALPEPDLAFLQLVANLAAGQYADSAALAADAVRVNDDWSQADVQSIVDSFGLAFPGDWCLAESWRRLVRAFTFLDNLNASADTVKTFAAAAMNRADAAALKQLLNSKFGSDTWLDMSGQIQDSLRDRKRSALDAYLLTMPMPADAPSAKWEDTDDLYAYYLLDVEMCSCMLTSRLVQASGSVQLFVQRCLMGLEPKVAVQADGDDGDSAWKWWAWMSKYRVWQANREVFLWPENWIEPELREENSYFFAELQKEILQNDITSDSAETAFANYLEKLDGVAQLEVAAFYHEDNADLTTVHVFGRTKGTEPHLYYYRTYDYTEWSAWQKVELDISGDFLIPAVLGQRLFLFWPVFTEVQDEDSNSKVNVPNPGDQGVSMQKTAKKLRVQIAVSEFRHQKWTPKRVSKDYIDSSAVYQNEMSTEHLRFVLDDRSDIDGRAGIKFDGFIKSTTLWGEELRIEMDGAFEIGGCHGVPEIGNFPETFEQVLRPTVASAGEFTQFLKWDELSYRKDNPSNTLQFQTSYAALLEILANPIVLVQTPDLFETTPAWNLSYMDKFWLDMSQMLSSIVWAERVPDLVPMGSWLPWFYNDKKRTFFVLPALVQYTRPVHQKIARETNVNGAAIAEANPDGSADAALSASWLYYPQIKANFRALEDFFEGIVNAYVAKTPLSTLPAAEQQAISAFLQHEFPWEPPPPYTDAQAAALATRYYMRFFHYFMSWLSTLLFQFRQFDFRTFYHPLVCDFARLVNNPLKGIDALMARETQMQQTDFSFQRSYQPTPWVIDPSDPTRYPKEDVDFAPDGAYSPYNWELFFHVPLFIADSLSQNQQFEQARDWYHYIFNPVGVESAAPGGSAMSKYWITKPFYLTTDAQYVQQRIDNILAMLAGDTNVPGYTPDLKSTLDQQVLDWRTYPFEPHRIANYRTVAYQKTVVMKYLDNLIAWGDYLFSQNSMESINEATQLYIAASEILGPKPMQVPPRAKPPLETFNEMEAHFDSFSNELIQIENIVPQPGGNAPQGGDSAPLPMLYFCVPPNDKLLTYWDTVADRLYKIRHCMNIQGEVQQLPLFEPPIDPGALVKAVAGGMDIGSALASLNAPMPFYRFNIMVQRANEICADVKALGGALLAALEKKDAEALSLLRQAQEMRVQDAVKTLRQQQLDEAKANLESTKRTRLVTEERRNFYRDIQQLSAQEQLYLSKMGEAHSYSQAAQGVKLGASIASLLPAINLGASGFGATPVVTVKFGGLELGQAAGLAAEVLSFLSQIANDDAQMASTKGGFNRRWDDWKLQERLADKELDQIDAQLAAAQLRITIAQQELDNQNLQIDNAKEMNAFLHSKYTNEELYDWQIGQISGVYFTGYKLAYSLAQRAERCFRFELGVQDSSYIKFGYWDSLKKGLLAGEQLQYDLRRLETAYLEQNRREFELTKHVSLALLDPIALVKLRETGRCFVNLPEEIFDLDYPGHYFRRIKSVSVTLPCVVGPYTTASCTLRLTKNSIRIATTGDYPRATDDHGLPADDDRFIENPVSFKSIATSSSQNDSGVFELNFHDERYLPFEGAGAISSWSLELFNDAVSNNPDFGAPLRQFDYNTISDVIMQIKYTAREDAGQFKNKAVTNLRTYFGDDQSTNSLRLFDLRHEFPSEWERFLKPSDPTAPNVFKFTMAPDLFMARDAGKTLNIHTIWLLARCGAAGEYDVVMTPPAPDKFSNNESYLALTALAQYGGLHVQQQDVSALGMSVDPTTLPVDWQLQMTRPGGGNLEADASGAMEVTDMYLVLGYQWD